MRFVKQMEKDLDARLDALGDAAQRIADRYWQAVKERAAARDNAKPNLGLRVIRRENGLGIYWCRAYFFGPKGKRKVGFSSLPREGKTRYRWREVVRFAAGWEKELFDELEPLFSEIRSEVAEIGRLRKTVGRLRYLQKKGTWQDEPVVKGYVPAREPAQEEEVGGEVYDDEHLHEGEAIAD